MQSDGKNLSNAIHMMIDSKSSALTDIEDFIGHVLPSFKKIIPTTPDNNTKRSFEIRETNDVNCPASSLSDGTIKLIALLIGVFRQSSGIAIIEEPENYLHPWAPKLLIDLLRDHFSSGVCLITTHSETVLNSVKPNEIVVIENKKGVTTRTRIRNLGKLSKSIRDSGFGPGYHYISGSLGGVPE